MMKRIVTVIVTVIVIVDSDTVMKMIPMISCGLILLSSKTS
jgi:hypothetical protein